MTSQSQTLILHKPEDAGQIDVRASQELSNVDLESS